MQPDPAEGLAHLREHRLRQGQTQAELASELGVSQSTLSRRERQGPKRQSDATRRVCRYAKRIKVESLAGQDEILEALKKVRDTSAAHATALAKIIGALAELCEAGRKAEEQNER